MTELGDYQVQRPSPDASDGRPSRKVIAIAVAVLVVVGLALFWFLGGGDEPEAPMETATQAPAPRLATPPEPIDTAPAPLELPTLEDSDAFARDLVAQLSSHPGLASWLVSDRLIRRFVVTVDNIAEGSNPSQHVPFMEPDQAFAVSGEEPSARIDPRSYERYDNVAGVIDALDVDGTAELFATLEPLLDEAYAELGYPDTPFRTTLGRAIGRLLETPIPDTPPAVAQRATYYVFLDEDLQDLTAAQKQFIGMGPANMRKVKAKLRSLADALELRIR